MNCDGVRGLLSAYLDGELSPGELLRVEQHLRRCHCCADEVDSLRRTMVLVASLDEVEVPTAFRAQLHDRLVALGPPIGARRLPAARVWQRHLRNWGLPAAAAAAVLAVGLSTFSGGGELAGLEVRSPVSVNEPAQTPAQPAPVKAPLPGKPEPTAEPPADKSPAVTAQQPQPKDPSGTAVSVPSPEPIEKTVAASPAAPPKELADAQTLPDALSAYTASHLNGISPIESIGNLNSYSYSLTATVADPAAVAAELRSRYASSTSGGTVNATTVVITVNAAEAKAELDYIRARLGENAEEKEPITSDLSASFKLSYTKLSNLDYAREMQVKAMVGVTDSSLVGVAKRELDENRKRAEEERANLEGLRKQLDHTIIIVTLQKQASQ